MRTISGETYHVCQQLFEVGVVGHRKQDVGIEIRPRGRAEGPAGEIDDAALLDLADDGSPGAGGRHDERLPGTRRSLLVRAGEHK